MAMEVNPPPKQLHKHAVPVVMILAALIVLSAAVIGHHQAMPSNAISRALTARILRIGSTSDTGNSSSALGGYADQVGSSVDASTTYPAALQTRPLNKYQRNFSQ